MAVRHRNAYIVIFAFIFRKREVVLRTLTHYRYTKKKGKIYGPYVYENKRINGKVVSKYVGKSEESKGKGIGKNYNLLLIVSILAVVLLAVFALNGGITGNVILNSDSVNQNYYSGENLSGHFSFSVQKNLINSAVLNVALGSQTIDINVNELVNSNSSLIYPDVDFNLLLVSSVSSNLNENVSVIEESSNGSTTLIPEVPEVSESVVNWSSEVIIGQPTETPTTPSAETAVEQIPIEQPIETPVETTPAETLVENPIPEQPVQTEPVQTTPVETSTPQTDSSESTSSSESTDSASSAESSSGSFANSESSSSSGESSGGESSSSESTGNSESSSGSSESSSSSSDSSGGITGNAILGEETQGNMVSGSARKGNDFSYDLNGQSASIEAGSVKYNGELIGDDKVDLKLESGKAVVSTDYSVESASNEITINIDLSKYNLVAENGVLKALLITGNESESVLEKSIIVSNESVVLEANLTVMNETIINVSISGLAFIGNIPSIRIQMGESYDLDLNGYFENAESYEFVSSNISGQIVGSVLTIIPDVDFKGSRKGKVIAYSGNESVESNQFNILVGGIKVDVNHGNITLGEKVKWTADVSLEGNDSAIVNLPKEAENITVNDAEVKVESNPGIVVGISGNVISDSNSKGIFRMLASWFSGGITGNVVKEDKEKDNNKDKEKDNGQDKEKGNGDSEIELNESIQNNTAEVLPVQNESVSLDISNETLIVNESALINEEVSIIDETVYDEDSLEEINLTEGNEGISLVLNVSQNYTIEYYTTAPISIEEETSYGKKVTISGPDLNYTNVLSFANVSELVNLGQEDKIKVYWVEENSYVPFDAYDLDDNGKIDYVEWITPHLSNQTFNIILITKAEHLDSNRIIIEDVYDYVKTLDNVTMSIPTGDYLRVRFERPLDSTKDITIYVMSNVSDENASVGVKVYEKDSNLEIADFGNVGDFGKYRILLTNLAETQDIFDLLIYGNGNSSVLFDYVVDPVNSPAQPTLISPSNGASGVLSPYTLSVSVSDPDGDVLNVTFWDKTSKISTGSQQSCSVLANGIAMCWGMGNYGQLGNGLSTSSSNPVYVNITNTFKAISTGLWFSCGILSNGTAMCWGYNNQGQLGDGTDSVNRPNPVRVNTANLFTAISAGYKHSCGIISNGSAMCWGYAASGQLGNAGTTQQDSPVYVNTANTFTSISAGGLASCGILSNGTAMCWGGNGYGQLGNSGAANPSTSPIYVNTANTFTSISAGYFHACGIISNGSAMCWGYGNYGAIGDGSTTTRADPVYVNTTNRFVQIAVGQVSTCGILSDGRAMCWGTGTNGQLGNGLGATSVNPVYVNTTNTFVDISCDPGDYYSCCGIISNGSAMCWGSNAQGQIGDGSTTTRNNPVYVNTSNAFASRIISASTNVASGGSASFSWSSLNFMTSYLWGVTVDDSSLIANSPTWLFTTQSLPPVITIVAPTETDGSKYSRNNIAVNITMTDSAPANITINLYNSTGLVNSSVSANAALNYFVNFTSLSDGIYYFNATAMNTGGITNSTSTRNVSIDNSVPLITVTNPTNTIYNNATITINFTSSDALSSIDSRWFFNGTGNTTYADVVIQLANEGSNTFIFYSNDSIGNLNSTSVTFSVDTVYPQIQMAYPANVTYDYIVSDLNYSYSDLNVGSCWYTNNSGVNNYSVGCGVNITEFSSDQGSNTWIIYGNDSANNVNSSSITFFVDSIIPGVNFADPTEVNGAIYARENIAINVTISDVSPGNITISLYNITGLVNTSVSLAGALSYFINYTSLSEGVYYFNATAVDTLSNINNSETREVTIDLSPPTFTITNPLNQTYNTNNVSVEFTSTDSLSSIDSRWFYNGTGNTTYTTPTSQIVGQGSNIFIFYTNDSAGNVNSTAITFAVDSVYPQMQIVYPENITYNSIMNVMNYSASDNIALSSCWYFNGTGNTTIDCALNITTGLLSTQGSNTWIIYGNDSANNVNSSSITFFVDSINPGVNFTSPSEITGSYLNRDNIVVNVTMDDANPANITVKLYNITGLVNTSVSANGLASYFVNYTGLADGNYTFNATVVDMLSNQNDSESINVVIDTINPRVEYGTSTEENNSNLFRSNAFVNVTISDLYPKNITIRLYNDSALWYESSSIANGGSYSVNFTGLDDQIYYFNATVFDLAGNRNQTETRTINVVIDYVNPSVYFVSSSDNTGYQNRSNIYVNVTTSDKHFANMTISLFNSSSIVNETVILTGGNYILNYTNLPDERYYVNASTLDLSGNRNQTETRNITIDTTNPLISYGSGMESDWANVSRNWIFVNLSVVETNEANTTFNLYNSTGIFNSSASNGQRTINWTGVPNGLYYYNVSILDLVNKINHTETRRIVLDTVAPIISYMNSTSVIQNSTVNLTLAVSDELSGMSAVIFEVHYSNGSIANYTPSLLAGVYNLSLQNLTEIGDYVVNGYANDSAGNNVNSSTSFEIYIPLNISGVVTDASGLARSYAYSFYSPGTDTLKYNFTGNNYSSSDLHLREYDMVITTESSHKIILYNLTMNQSIIPIQIDNFTSGTISNHKILVGLGINSTFNGNGILNISYLGLFNSELSAINESQLEVYKCSNWSYTGRSCTTSYENYTNYTVDSANDRVVIVTNGFSSYALSERTCGNGICQAAYGETTSTCSVDCSSGSGETVVNLGGGGGGGSSTSIVKSSGLQFNILKIERQVPIGDSVTENLEIDNSLTYDMVVKVSVSESLKSLVSVDESTTVKALGSKSIPITIIGTSPGVYTGDISLETNVKNYSIPTTILVSGKSDMLLDLNIVLAEKSVSAGDDLDFTMSAFNLGKLQRYDIFLDYAIQKKDSNVTIVSNSESFAIETSLSLARKLNVPRSTKNGDYMVVLKASYGDNQTAIASANFRVGMGGLDGNGTFSNYLSMISAAALLIVLVGGSIYYFVTIRRKLFEKKMEEIKKNSIFVFPDFKLLPQSKFAYVGMVADTDVKTYLDYTQLNRHTLIAGGTGSGKTVAGMVVVEELIKRGTNVIVLDPVGQWTGFANKNNDKIMSNKYKKFGISSPKAFPVSIVEINKSNMNLDIHAYMNRKGLVVLKMSKLSPKDIDLFVEQCLRRIYTADLAETSALKSVIVLDEVHRILPKYGGKKAYVRLEQAVREFRKWGVGLLMISQVLTDFKGAIRGNIGTEIQLQTRYEGDIKRVRERSGSKISRLVSKLPVGLGIVECPSYNHGAPYFVEFRPLLHSPFKLTDQEIAKYTKKENPILQKVEDLKKVPSSVAAPELDKKEEHKAVHHSAHSSSHKPAHHSSAHHKRK